MRGDNGGRLELATSRQSERKVSGSGRSARAIRTQVRMPILPPVIATRSAVSFSVTRDELVGDFARTESGRSLPRHTPTGRAARPERVTSMSEQGPVSSQPSWTLGTPGPGHVDEQATEEAHRLVL